MVSKRTEKAIKKVIDTIKAGEVVNVRLEKQTVVFLSGAGESIAKFTLSSLVKKRLPKRKSK